MLKDRTGMNKIYLDDLNSPIQMKLKPDKLYNSRKPVFISQISELRGNQIEDKMKSNQKFYMTERDQEFSMCIDLDLLQV